MVLLIFCSISVPVWNKVSFLDATYNSKSISFGAWGYTGSSKTLGYSWTQALGNISNTRLSQSIFNNLTYVLILHPIGAGLSALAVVFGICGAGYSRIGTILMSLCAALALLVTLVAWIIDLVMFGIARDEIRSHGGSAQYGIANWFAIAAWVSLCIGFCAGICGSLGRYRERRYAAKV